MKKYLYIAIIAITMLLASPSLLCADTTRYDVIEIGSFGGINDRAYDINNIGQVTGESARQGGYPRKGFIWDEINGIKDLGDFGGSGNTRGYSINDSGQVVGASFGLDGRDHAFIWDSTNGMQDLGSINGSITTMATGINNLGKVVGVVAVPHPHSAFIWDSTNGIQTFGPFGWDRSFQTSDINNNGQICGSGTPTSESLLHAFIWDSTNGIQNLGTLGGQESDATCINDLGQVVGMSRPEPDSDGNSNFYPFLWNDASGMLNLGSLGDLGGCAYGINNYGQVVGYSPTGEEVAHAFIWDSTNGMRDLNDLISNDSGWSIREAQAINDLGQIVGWGVINGETHAVLLNPVPEPATMLLLPLGLAGFRFFRRRKT